MSNETIEKLIEEAKEIANRNFCCKNSNFTVGAALLTNDNEIYKGFNVENDGIQSICAERVAFVKALSNDKHEFQAIAIVSRFLNEENFRKTLPCGYCRQFLSQYGGPDLLIYTIDENNQIICFKSSDLLPHSFDF